MAEKNEDRKGGPGHTVVLAVLLVFPILKVAWTVGGGDAAWGVLVALQPANWLDVLMGMIRGSAVLAFVLAVVVSRMSFVFMAARGSLHHESSRAQALSTLMSLVAPTAFGLLMTVFFDWRWGVLTAVVGWLLRQGVVLEYRTGHRGGRERAAGLAPWQHRAISAERIVVTVLSVLVLPVAAPAVALDGESWATLVRCEVQIGTSQQANTLIELTRMGNGIVGWDLDRNEVANAAGCEKLDGLVVREPWWRR
ncbi:hypothetical protein GCM10009839_51390 [Catenulispora yoronensis]|uniref:Uncharacterized protein n=1 Tax=Catenulispora yoronensis TaxID=450799 RepID=A0ABN2URK2_9ACTN